jgi:hypothetical protein
MKRFGYQAYQMFREHVPVSLKEFEDMETVVFRTH